MHHLKEDFIEIRAWWLNCSAVATMVNDEWGVYWLMAGQRCEDIAECGGYADSAGAWGDFLLDVIWRLSFAKQFGTRTSPPNVTNHLMFGTYLHHKHLVRQRFLWIWLNSNKVLNKCEGPNIIPASRVERWEVNHSCRSQYPAELPMSKLSMAWRPAVSQDPKKIEFRHENRERITHLLQRHDIVYHFRSQPQEKWK